MIRAGRGQDGQPRPPDPAKPDPGSSSDPSFARDDAGTSATTLTEADPGGPADDDAAAGIESAAGIEGGTSQGKTAGADGRRARRRGSPAASDGNGGALGRALGRTWVRHLILIVVYQGAGIAATWPRVTYLASGKLPATADVSSYVWDLWWVVHQLLHFGNPFFSTYWAAPVGTHLAFSTLMPLVGWIMAPITLLFGPSASFTLLTIVTPGLLCYVMYRAARLWLNEPGAITAGAFFGLSSMLLWQNWYHLNIALGTIFLPMAIEAAVRFRRRPRMASAVALGVTLGASILVNQESTVVAVVIAILTLIPWLAVAAFRNRELFRQAIKPLTLGALVAFVIALPELVAMLQQIVAGGANPPIGQLASYYAQFGVSLPTLFAPSPRLANFGLGHLASSYSYYNPQQALEGLPTFGAVLTALALLGILVGARKRSTWAFVGMWLGCAAVALGTSVTIGRNCVISGGIYHQPGRVYGRFCTQYLPLMTHFAATRVTYKGGPVNGVWRHVVASDLMPYTWLVRIPGMSGLREADRFALVGLIGAAMLAGLTVQWLSKRRATRPLIVVVVALGALEAGWSGAPVTSPGYPSNFGYHGTMRSTLAELDRPLTRDHTGSIVVDVPYGLRGGVGVTGQPIAPSALVLATHDMHPRAIAYTAWVSKATNKGIAKHAFFRYLYIAEKAGPLYPTRIAAARADLKTLHIGWVIEWRNVWTDHHQWGRYRRLSNYLEHVGFRLTHDYCLVPGLSGIACPRGQHVWLYRYAPGTPLDSAG
jgi:hypothetical protein